MNVFTKNLLDIAYTVLSVFLSGQSNKKVLGMGVVIAYNKAGFPVDCHLAKKESCLYMLL